MASAALIFALTWAAATGTPDTAAADPSAREPSPWAARALSAQIDLGSLTPLGYTGMWIESVPFRGFDRWSFALGLGQSLVEKNMQRALAFRYRLVDRGPVALIAGAGLSNGRWDQSTSSTHRTRLNTELIGDLSLPWGLFLRATGGLGVTLANECRYCRDVEAESVDAATPYASLSLGYVLVDRRPVVRRDLSGWYGYKLLATDLAVIGTMALAVGGVDASTLPWERPEKLYPTKEVLAGIAGLVLVSGGAVIHLQHRRPLAALGSVLLRTVLPLVALRAGQRNCGDCSYLNEGAVATGFVIGALIDAALAWR